MARSKIYCFLPLAFCNGDFYLAKLSVEEMAKTNRDNILESTIKRLYNLKDIKIVPIALFRGVQSRGNPLNNSGAQPIGTIDKYSTTLQNCQDL